jgi:uncharacterized membrane protein YdbT with pleckstrin-like domain
MSYVDKNLMQNEVVIHRAKMHWFAYIPSVLLILFGLAMTSVKLKDGGSNPFAILVILVGFYKFIGVLILVKTTELAVTSKRVIAKTGLIRRSTIELNHSKVESYKVNQSIFGRLLGYGTLEVNGTGGGITPIQNIDSPLEFRKKAMEVADCT